WAPARMDPITLEICWNRLIGVVNEQAAALQRTSFTSIVREAGDLSAGVFDRRGYMVAQAVTGTPGHINSMALAMKHFLAACPLETLRPGDVLITNDPWLTSGHLNDVTIASPIFRGEECIAFFASTCHTADIGGHVLSAEAREVYEEGLQIPIMKLYEAGRPNEALIAIIRANVRVPEMVLGDFHAQIAGGAVGGERLREFMDEFGLERLEPLADEIIGRTERAMRAAIKALTPGAYEYAITSDGFDEPLTIRARCPRASWRRARPTSGASRSRGRTSAERPSRTSSSPRAAPERAPRRTASRRPRSRRVSSARPSRSSRASLRSSSSGSA